jgi:hypothetical protein
MSDPPYPPKLTYCGIPNMTAITTAIAINAHNVQKPRALIIAAAPIPSSARRVPTGYEECHVFFRAVFGLLGSHPHSISMKAAGPDRRMT